MDFVHPVRAVIPGVQGRILAVLAETSGELNLRAIARLSGVSLAQASRVLPTLVELGIVERREAPPSALFRYVPQNVAARAVTALANSRRSVLEEIGRDAATLSPRPASLVVFGSFARGEADSQSDLDIVVVRPSKIDLEHIAWRSTIEQWLDRTRRLTGNHIEIVEVSEQEAGQRLRGRSQLWLDVQRDGVVVFGKDLAQLKGQRSA